MRRTIILGVLLVLFTDPFALRNGFATPLRAASALTVTQRDKVYRGDPDSFRNPAVLAIREVYEKIPSYRRIRDEGLTPDNPRYWVLLARASEAFYVGVNKVADKMGFDLVAERGAVKMDGAEPPDITSPVADAAADHDRSAG